jgi:hypothetical protein
MRWPAQVLPPHLTLLLLPLLGFSMCGSQQQHRSGKFKLPAQHRSGMFKLPAQHRSRQRPQQRKLQLPSQSPHLPQQHPQWLLQLLLHPQRRQRLGGRRRRQWRRA